LLKLERKTNTNTSQDKLPKHYNTFIQFENHVKTNYTKTGNMKDYVDLLSVSTKHLNQVVKEFTINTNTVKVFIDDYVTLEAKRAIVISKNSVKEIAFPIGFGQIKNFAKFFEKKMGITPIE
jgi:AraC family transcriptional activator of pobA